MHREKGLAGVLAFVLVFAPAIAMAGGSVTMSWNANNENDLAGYRIYYGTSSGNYSAVVDAGAATTFTINSLQDGKTYYFVMTAYDNAGNESGYSSEVSATILDTTPPLITAVAATNLTTSGATITWTTDEPSDSQVDYGISSSYGASSPLNSQMVTSHSVTLTGLSASGTYHFRANSRDAAGRLATSNDFTFLTLAPDAIPPAISNISANFISHNSATITWTTNEPADGQVEFGETTAYGKLSPLSANLQTEHSATISGLSASTTYHFRILSRDGGGNLASSTDQIFTTTIPAAFARRINAGGAAFTDASNQAWSADQEYGTGLDWGFEYGQARVQANAIAGTEDDVLFQSARLGAGTYRFEVPAVAVYRVNLYFAETQFASAGQRVFDVNLENNVVIDDLDLAATVGQNAAMSYSFDVEVSDGRVTIKFIAVTGEPLISAVEITSTDPRAASDVTPPEAMSARLTSPNTLTISFNEAVGNASAQNIANYSISPAVSISSAALQSDQRTILLNTAAHAAGQNYTLTVRNVADVATPPNVMSAATTRNYSFQTVDAAPPAALSAIAVNKNTVSVFFSEAVSASSAQNVSNYSIAPAIAIQGAALQSDNRTVILTTADHANGASYALTVRGISDRATPPNTMANAAAVGYAYQTDDTTPPRIAAARINSPTQVVLVFSEPVTVSSAQTAGNYRISGSVSVNTARLAENGLEVELATSAHQYNHDYQVVVNNIRDRSAAANIIAANSSAQYRLSGNDEDDDGNGIVINAISQGNYQIDSLRVGDTYYVDRSYRINHIPTSKKHVLWIRTANGDKANTASDFLEFNLNREADVYVAYDSRATGVPAWLSRDFDKTNDYVGVSETVGRLDLWRRHFLPGRVRLGGNLASGAANVNSMYVVLIDDLTRPADNSPEAPRSFVLYQNFPNPFNPRTEISFYVERESNVVINIYNSLGQVVHKLYDGKQTKGQHRLTWDAKNDQGNPVPSGTYLYTLEVRDQMSSGDVVMNSAISRQSRLMTLLK